MEFIEARWYTPVKGTRRIDFIVLHSMEAPEKGTTAESVARYFAAGTVKASAHYNVDSDSIVQSVRENDIAYHAPPNTHSLGIEHAGYARQTRAQWLDAYGLAMLRRSAGLVRELCDKYDIPRTFLTVTDLKAGKRGITTHANVSKAFGQSTHTDPGAAFPLDHYMALVKITPKPVTPAPAPVPSVPASPSKDDSMTLIVAPGGSAYHLTGNGLVWLPADVRAAITGAVTVVPTDAETWARYRELYPN